MQCIYAGNMNGKKLCLAGFREKEECDEERCRFYVDAEAVKKNGGWDRFGFGKEAKND